MLFLCLFYIIYALAVRENISIKRAVRNKWIWLLAIMFVIADRALFIANADPASKVTVMTLIKQAGAIVTILAGKFIFKEKNVGHKLICAGVIIVGIMLSVF
jgi:drug/metabolite transporter (DMT)-like permease